MIPIRQELDPSRLEPLSEEEREAAEDAGELDGNHHYSDLSFATWDDVAYALKVEGRLIAGWEAAGNPDALLAELDELRESEEERDALWQLELGVAAPVMALNVMGAHTALSCNGGQFGGTHLRDCPSIRFYPQRASIEDLLSLARASAVGLVNEEGRALLYAVDVRKLQKFAALAIERHGHVGSPLAAGTRTSQQ